MTSPNDTPLRQATAAAPRTVVPRRETWAHRTWARLFAARYDQQVDQGLAVGAGTALAAHHRRLTSRRERADLAAALEMLLQDVGHLPRRDGRPLAVPVDATAIRRSAGVVDDVRARLLGPLPVRARGMARLRILLGDGRGPTYRAGRGTFASAIRGVLAAM